MAKSVQAKNPQRFVKDVMALLEEKRPVSKARDISLRKLFSLGYHPSGQRVEFGLEKKNSILELVDEECRPAIFSFYQLDEDQENGIILPREFKYYMETVERWLNRK